MKIKNYHLIVLLFILIKSVGCNSGNEEAGTNTDSLTIKEPIIKTGTFYSNNLDAGNAILLADTIAYDVTIKNPDPSDEWTEQDLGRMDELALANMIYNAIYQKKLIAYDYQFETPMTIEEVKAKESEFSRDKIGRMRFVEEWYFDEKNLQFGKKINTIMIAYEQFLPDGQVRYIPGVMVYLNDSTKNNPKILEQIK